MDEYYTRTVYKSNVAQYTFCDIKVNTERHEHICFYNKTKLAIKEGKSKPPRAKLP